MGKREVKAALGFERSGDGKLLKNMHAAFVVENTTVNEVRQHEFFKYNFNKLFSQRQLAVKDAIDDIGVIIAIITDNKSKEELLKRIDVLMSDESMTLKEKKEEKPVTLIGNIRI